MPNILMGDSLVEELKNRCIEEIDYSVDLHRGILKNPRDWNVFFFERPIISNFELFKSIIEASIGSFSAGMFVAFGKPESEGYAQVVLANFKVSEFIKAVEGYFSNFYNGMIDYPIVISNESLDWFAYEVESEDIGVILIKKSKMGAVFVSDISGYLISCSDMANDSSVYSSLRSNYGCLVDYLRDTYCSF